MTTDHDPPVASVDATPTGPERERSTRVPLVAVLLGAGAFVVALVFAATADWTEDDSLSASVGLPDLTQELEAHEWLLDPAGSSITVDEANPVTLVFGDDRVSGIAPCNSYRASLAVDDDDDSISIADVSRTRKACEPTVMRAEDEYLAALVAVRDVDLPEGYDQDRLTLTNDSGDRLTYTAIDFGDLAVGQWYVVNIARGGALQSVVDGTQPTLEFHADGDIALDTGCNPIRGTYALDGDRLHLGDLAQTARECPEPAGVMDQELALARALEAGEQMTVVPGQLTLLDANGNIVLAAAAEPTP